MMKNTNIVDFLILLFLAKEEEAKQYKIRMFVNKNLPDTSAQALRYHINTLLKNNLMEKHTYTSVSSNENAISVYYRLTDEGKKKAEQAISFWESIFNQLQVS